MRFEIVTPPAIEPITFAEVQANSRIDIEDEQTLIEGMIVAARETVEQDTGRSLITQTIKAYWDRFQRTLYLPQGPVTSITDVQYLDDTGATITVALAEWQADLVGVPARLLAARDTVWPTSDVGRVNNVFVTYVAGYGTTASDVPQNIRRALLLMVSTWFENRETFVNSAPHEIPFGARALLARYFAHRMGAEQP